MTTPIFWVRLLKSSDLTCPYLCYRWTTASLRKDLAAELPTACWDALSDARILRSFCCLSLQYDGADLLMIMMLLLLLLLAYMAQCPALS